MQIEINCCAEVPLQPNEAGWLSTVLRVLQDGSGQLPPELANLISDEELTGIAHVTGTDELVLEMIGIPQRAFDAVLQLLSLVLKSTNSRRSFVLEYSAARITADGRPVSFGGGVVVIEKSGSRVWKTEAFIAGAFSEFEENAGQPQGETL